MAEESPTADLAELGRQVNEAASRRDFDAMMSFFGPAPVWDLSPMGLGVYEGVAAIRGFFEDWIGSYDEIELGGEELLDLGEALFGFSFASRLSAGFANVFEFTFEPTLLRNQVVR